MHDVPVNESRLFHRIQFRILPVFVLCYVLAYLDRINIGFAKLQMQLDTGLTDAAYGLGAGMFFIGYIFFEIPSSLWLLKIGARRTISRIMICWGLTSAAMLFVSDPITFYMLRFLLGVFEAGFAPAMLFYLTVWFPEKRMARALAITTAAPSIAGVIAGPLSTGIMTAFDGVHGLAGWQWMFLLEGLPCVFVGLAVFWWVDDHPSKAGWLSNAEKAAILSQTQPRTGHTKSFWQAAADPFIYVLAAGYFCIICGIYAITFWLPTIVKAAGVQDLFTIGVYTAIPYLVSIPAVYALSASSDRHGERRLHAGLAIVLGAAALVVSIVYLTNLVVALTGMTIAASLIFAGYAVFWAIPSDRIKGDGAAGSIALINTIGLVGGFLSPNVIGFMQSAYGDLRISLIPIIVLLVIGGVSILCNRNIKNTPRDSNT